MKIVNLIDLLSVGESNAITGKTLAKLLGWSERDVTICVNALRKQGELICSGTNGFWLPADDEDIKAFVRQMNGRIADMRKATKPAEDYLCRKQEECEGDCGANTH